MNDEMFFSEDGKSLRRGKRTAPRTQTFRPCLVWTPLDPDTKWEGVVLDVNPHGMLVRMLDTLELGTAVRVQLMRDEQFDSPLADPHHAKVVRYKGLAGVNGYTDHGLRLEQPEIRRKESRPIEVPKPRPMPRRRSRMHTIDVTIGERDSRRAGRSRR